MHPNERAATAIACPICKMTMVPIPPLRIGEYRMDVTGMPAPGGRGFSGLRLELRDPDSGAAVTSLQSLHDYPLHLFVVGQDLEFFAHVHPSPAGGAFRVRQPIPPGAHMVIADFMPAGGVPQLIQRMLVAPGAGSRPALEPPALRAGPAVQRGSGVRIELAADLIAGKAGLLVFRLTNEKDGTPIRDLEAYLGAPGHVLIVSRDLTEVTHAHAEEWQNSLTFDVILPVSGPYKLWFQFQRRGAVVTVPFVINVS